MHQKEADVKDSFTVKEAAYESESKSQTVEDQNVDMNRLMVCHVGH